MCLQLMCLFLPLSSSLHKLQEDVELEWLRQTEVLYYRLEHSHSNAVQLRHNPWSLKCQQHHLQKMKENAKHHNQYSILSLLEDCPVFFFYLFLANIQYHSIERQDSLFPARGHGVCPSKLSHRDTWTPA